MPFYCLKYTWIYFPFTFLHKGNCKVHEIFTAYESCSVPIKTMIMFCFTFQKHMVIVMESKWFCHSKLPL